MLVLFTDFGIDDVYVAQMKVALLAHAPDALIIDLLHHAPAFEPKPAAHLLAALRARFPTHAVFVAVVDPGVGGTREAIAIEADEQWYVGPDNGLLSVVAARAKRARCFRIAWRPERLSASFHGRDLFAPVAAWIASGDVPRGALEPISAPTVQLDAGDLPQVIYIDHYGNAVTGLRSAHMPQGATLEVERRIVPHARVFVGVPAGAAFWYANSIGLAEIAVNRGSAATSLNLAVGSPVRVIV
jgi:S-adenosylmethionine hydrolase